MFRRVILGLAFLSTAFAPVLLHAQTPTDSIRQLEKDWESAFNHKDIRSVAALYAEDAWLILPGDAPAKGRPAVSSALQAMPAGLHIALETQSVLRLGPDLAVENGVAQLGMAGAPSGAKRSNYQVLWRRDHGRWCIVRDIVSPL